MASPSRDPREATAKMGGAIEIRPVFFPPSVPVFGGTLGGNTTRIFNGQTYAAPAELAEDAGEFFYPALGSRLFEKKLDEKVGQQLAAYHAARAALLNELQNKLTALQDADVATREHELLAFAPSQTPRLVALQAQAEQLREKLIRSGFYNADWNQNRGWKLGTPAVSTRPSAPAAEYEVIRAAAHYQPGLSPEQHGLLREIAMEQAEEHRTHSSHGRFNSDPFVLFFSPETSRFRLPEDLSRELEPKIATFIEIKNSLKEELRDTVIAGDIATASDRTKAFQQLAEAQWPRLATDENLAEEIRRELAARPAPPLPALPPTGAHRAHQRLQTRKRRLERERAAQHMYRGIPAAMPALSPGGTTQERIQGFREIVNRRIEQREKTEEQFREENSDRYEALAESLKSIKADLEAFAQTQIDSATDKPMDIGELMRRINTADQQFEKIGREEAIYKDYRVAMLEPGLSPEQRRLLFGAALAGLAQPLPTGGPMPNGSFPAVSF